MTEDKEIVERVDALYDHLYDQMCELAKRRGEGPPGCPVFTTYQEKLEYCEAMHDKITAIEKELQHNSHRKWIKKLNRIARTCGQTHLIVK